MNEPYTSQLHGDLVPYVILLPSGHMITLSLSNTDCLHSVASSVNHLKMFLIIVYQLQPCTESEYFQGLSLELKDVK